MPIAPLSDDDVHRIAAAYRLPVTDQELESYRALADALLTSYEQVERRYQASLAEPPVRSWERPVDEDNPLGAWYVTTRIQTRDDGPLAGRQIAIKDNIEVAACR
jgi:amidase